MYQLQKITSEYIEIEDRIRLSGETEEGQTVVLWLTQRLLGQVISHLLNLIENQSSEISKQTKSQAPISNLMQGFAQQAAQSELGAEKPVEATPGDQGWLVLEVDIALSPEGTLVLVFKRELGTADQQDDTGKATLTVEAKQLRQWLSIVHAQWLRGGWSQKLWPSWMDEQPTADTASPLH